MALRVPSKPWRTGRAYPLQMIIAVLMAWLTVSFFFPQPEALSFTIGGCLAIAYAMLVRAFLRPVSLIPGVPSFLTIEALFLLFYFLLFFLPYQSYLFFDEPLWYSRFFADTFPDYAEPAILCSTIGMLAFCLGIDGPRSRRDLPPSAPAPIRHADGGALNLVLLVLLASLIALYIGAGFHVAGEARYAGVESGGSAANIYDVITLLSIMILAQFAAAWRARRVSMSLLIGIAIVAIWSLRILAFGDRNGFFLIGTAAAAAIAAYKVRMSRPLLAGLFAASIILYNAVEVVRMRPDASLDRLYEQIVEGRSGQETMGDSSFSITTVTVRAAIATVPSVIPYGYGRYKLLGVAGVVPFLRGLVLPGGAETSADALTGVILGGAATWGVGSSVIADAYLDFGLFGVMMILYLIGYAGRRIQSAAIANPHSSLTRCSYVTCIAYFSEYPRYSFEFPINSLVWGAALIILVRWAFATRRRGRASPLGTGPARPVQPPLLAARP